MQKNRPKYTAIFWPVLFSSSNFFNVNSVHTFQYETKIRMINSNFHWTTCKLLSMFGRYFSLVFIYFALYVHTNECLLSDLVRKGRINSLFGSLIVNMAHIDSSFAYFGSPKGSPKYCKRLVNMSAYSLSGNRITRNYQLI